jgi:hypothetical protein
MIHRPTALALIALACSAGAWAQSSDRPYYVGVRQDFTHDSNSLSAPAADAAGDTVSTTTLLGGLNLPFGRQRAYLNASLFHQSYNNFSIRNNDGYDLGAGLDWSTIERLSGNLSLTSYRHQSSGFVGGIVPISLSNIQNSHDANARVRLGLDTVLAFDASFGHRQVRFSAPEYAAQEYHQDSGSVGVTYRPSGILTVGTGLSGQRTTYETAAIGQAAPDRNRRNDVYITAGWVPTGASSVNARINIGKTKYDLATANNFSGVTGSLSWSWRPTGLLALTTTLLRDTGQSAGFLQSTDPSKQTATNFSRLTNTVQLGADYELSGKIRLNAGVAYSRRTLADTTTGLPSTDNTTSLLLGARWAALRTLNLGCNVARESRTASGAGSTPYDNNRVGCFGQFTLD